MKNPVSIDWEARCRELYEESVASLDVRTRARLTEARHAALEAAGVRARAGARRTVPRWSGAAAGVAAALLIAVVLRIATPLGGSSAGTGGDAPRSEDAALVASPSPADDSVEMMREDADFYAWAAGVSAPADDRQAE
jgi:hypothetical protein